MFLKLPMVTNTQDCGTSFCGTCVCVCVARGGGGRGGVAGGGGPGTSIGTP